MAETRKIAAILAADVVGFSRMTSADEDGTLARLRALRGDLIDPTVAAHNGRVFKRTGDGALIEFRSVVDAVRCAIAVQNSMAERFSSVPPDRRIVFRIGIHLGDVVEESDGDLMGDGVNIAARLEGIAVPGAICLSEDAYRQVKARLDLAVTDLGPTRLKNIAEPVRAYSLQVGVPAIAQPATQAKPLKPRQRSMLAPLLVAAIVALAVVAGGTWYFLPRNHSASIVATNPPAAHLSIVVLPFVNLSGDVNQDYFADGITDNLTTDLSRIRDSFVIARNTAFTFKGKNVDVKEIGRELGVRYVLEGSVQRDQGRVRVNAQLIDAENGAHLWADRFEADVANLFILQDEVVARLGNSLGFQLIKAEAEKSARSKNPDAIELTMRAKLLLSSANLAKESIHAAQSLFEQALAIDPNNADSLSGSAQTYLADFLYAWTTTEIDYERIILDRTSRAIELDPANVAAYYTKALYLGNTSRPADGFRVADTGVAMVPSSAILHSARGVTEDYLHRFQEGKRDIEEAMRLSPRDPRTAQWHTFLSESELGLGHFDAAIDESKKAQDGGYRVFYTYVYRAAAYALKGDLDDARTNVRDALLARRDLTIKFLTVRDGAMLDSSLDALRKAGMPEQ